METTTQPGRLFPRSTLALLRKYADYDDVNRSLKRRISSDLVQQDARRRFKSEIFRVLAHQTRIHIVECLRGGEMTVSAILEQVAIEAANASQHLAVLRSKGLVLNRKEGAQVFYSLRDPLLIEVLEREAVPRGGDRRPPGL